MSDLLVKVVVHSADIVRIYHRNIGAGNKAGFLLYLHGLVCLRNVAIGRNCSPVSCLVRIQSVDACLRSRFAYYGMPNCNMFDIWMLISDVCYGIFQPMRKSLFVGFKVGPATLELVLGTFFLLDINRKP